MPKDFLKAEDIAAVYQVALGKSMAKGMRGTANSRYACPLTAAPEHLLDTASRQRQSVIAQEEPGYLLSQWLRSEVVYVFP